MTSYLKLALKVLARRKFFTFVSLFGISFTLVVLTFAAALLDSVFAPMAPESRQDRTLVALRAVMYGKNGMMSSEVGYRLLDQNARGLPGAERLSICSSQGTVYSYLNGSRVSSSLKRTDGEFWQIFDFHFLEGAPYTASDVDASRFVAVINESTRRRFFGDQAALGKTLEADGQRFQVIGVVADVPQTRFVPFADIWVPLTTAKSDGYRSELMGGFFGVVLARDRESLPQIRQEFEARLARVALPDRAFNTLVAPLESRFDAVARFTPLADRRDPSPQGWKIVALLTTVTLVFMLLPAMNLINLNVSRILERASEIGVRKAFGAPTLGLVGQFVLENVVLTVLGGLLGLVIAAVVLHSFNQSGMIPYASLQVNLRVFLVGLGLAVLFGLLSGAYPAWRMARLRPVEALKGVSR
jgi:putative ABC transport system permease protein